MRLTNSELIPSPSPALGVSPRPGASHAAHAAINRGIADAQGIGEINARIARLESILDDRGVEYVTE